jgi:hypothetical protein
MPNLPTVAITYKMWVFETALDMAGPFRVLGAVGT